ncbi:MAG: Tm-1-like ATP-binding domain-containing protein, partial [Pararhodobacter sp.]|nr:Tm-1-like ATP-binding domain-containing protein [Pararhodobacter sp.]
MDKTILVIGTYDTKDQELHYMCERIRALGGRVVSMDVSVLGDPSQPTDISKHDVTAAVGKTIQDAIGAGDENGAMQIMAAGAVLGAARAVEAPVRSRPVIGMMSLGSSCLRYMTLLRDPLQARGFEVAVFHATGMGGMAFEALAKQGYFAAVL